MAMIKMGSTYCARFSSHFALKTIEKFYPKLSGTLVEFVGLKWGQLGKGNFVFDLKHFWDALQTFYTLWGTFV